MFNLFFSHNGLQLAFKDVPFQPRDTASLSSVDMKGQFILFFRMQFFSSWLHYEKNEEMVPCRGRRGKKKPQQWDCGRRRPVQCLNVSTTSEWI